MDDDVEFKRLLLGLPEYCCARCTSETCMGFRFIIYGNNGCEITYFLCWTCRNKMPHLPVNQPAARVDSNLAAVQRLMSDWPKTSTNSNLYTFRPD